MSPFLGLALQTIRTPRIAWQRLTAADIPLRDRWAALVAVVALSTLLAWLLNMAALAAAPPPPPTAEGADITEMMRQLLDAGPMTYAVMRLGLTVLLVFMITRIGGFFGGHGRFADVLLAMVWIEAILIIPQAIKLLLIYVSFSLASFLALGETMLYLYLGVRLTQLVHGFRNAGLVAIGMFMSFFALVFIFAILLTLLGFTPPEF